MWAIFPSKFHRFNPFSIRIIRFSVDCGGCRSNLWYCWNEIQRAQPSALRTRFRFRKRRGKILNAYCKQSNYVTTTFAIGINWIDQVSSLAFFIKWKMTRRWPIACQSFFRFRSSRSQISRGLPPTASKHRSNGQLQVINSHLLGTLPHLLCLHR